MLTYGIQVPSETSGVDQRNLWYPVRQCPHCPGSNFKDSSISKTILFRTRFRHFLWKEKSWRLAITERKITSFVRTGGIWMDKGGILMKSHRAVWTESQWETTLFLFVYPNKIYLYCLILHVSINKSICNVGLKTLLTGEDICKHYKLAKLSFLDISLMFKRGKLHQTNSLRKEPLFYCLFEPIKEGHLQNLID